MKRSLRGPIIDWFVNLIRNSKYRWVVILGSLVYLLSPLDISPDVFPIIGWIDDGLLATIVMTELTTIVLDQRRKNVTLAGRKNSTDPAETVEDTVIDVESYSIS